MKIRKELIGVGAAFILLLAILFVVGLESGETKVDFTTLDEDKIPQSIVTDVIPEYRDMERALACIVDKKVYVIVTRGEKPTAGYEIEIDKMILENKGDKANLAVCANFADPGNEKTVAQIISYPLVVAETSLKGLPDTIELRIQYVE
ncbi:MAG: protease complex subunit PrcB family protein [Eubacteriales bacterium]|nr:protease complex subunit PrcB family protein [Eubacteriales bacterium]